MALTAPAHRRSRTSASGFGSVIALEDVSMAVQAGEVHCLLGDNGAGKSTLIKTLSGVHQPTAGQILIEGQPGAFQRPSRRPRPRHRHGVPGPRHGFR